MDDRIIITAFKPLLSIKIPYSEFSSEFALQITKYKYTMYWKANMSNEQIGFCWAVLNLCETVKEQYI